MALLRILNGRPGLPPPDVSGDYITCVRRSLRPPVVLLDAELFDNLQSRLGLHSQISRQLERIAAAPGPIRSALADLREDILRIELPALLLRELKQTLAPMLDNGPVDVVTSPVDAVAPLDAYFSQRGICDLSDLLSAIKASWASLYGVETDCGFGTSPLRAAVAIGHNLPAAPRSMLGNTRTA